MKKNNNKYRNNYSSIYSLNYKFDSCSVAGKISGTALDLIKKYNELAKEAQSNGDYVNAEVFRQYAEHYRKIVTEINEKRAQNTFSRNQRNARSEDTDFSLSDSIENTDTDIVLEEVNKATVIDITAELKSEPDVLPIVELETPVKTPKKSFTVIEIKPEETQTVSDETVTEVKPRRRTTRKKIEKSDDAVAV